MRATARSACATSAIGFQRRLAARFGVDADRVRLDHAGLNHLSWIRRVLVDGVDRLPELLASPRPSTSWPPRPRSRPSCCGRSRAIPSYYLHYFYCTDHAVRAQADGRTGPTEVLEIERTLLAMYADPTLDHKPELLEQRGGAYYSEAAAALVTSLLTGDGAHHYVDVRNNGTIAGLPDEAVVEVPAHRRHGPARTRCRWPPLAAGDARPGAGGTAYEVLADRGGPDRDRGRRAAGAAGQPAGAPVGRSPCPAATRCWRRNRAAPAAASTAPADG